MEIHLLSPMCFYGVVLKHRGNLIFYLSTYYKTYIWLNKNKMYNVKFEVFIVLKVEGHGVLGCNIM
jgi:hypothetical protein